MILGDWARKALTKITPILAAAVLAFSPQMAMAQDATAPLPPAASTSVVQAPDAPAVADAAKSDQLGSGSYKQLGPEWVKGQPRDQGITFQPQYTADGRYARWMHNDILLPIITMISLLVLGLLLFVITRFNKRRNPVASKTTHNTMIEVIWTLVPVLILVVIAVPSITLLARQYKSPPANAVTIKATGYQWYWGYTYPDNGGFEVISNMLTKEQDDKLGEPRQLGVDHRMVVPVNTPLRIQTTGADVIHSFAVPSLWFKLDAVPGRLNERLLTIDEPGIYYGQCSELCGARHGFMPIAIEAVPRAQWEAWVREQGGTVGKPAAAAASAATTDAGLTPAAAEVPAAPDEAPQTS